MSSNAAVVLRNMAILLFAALPLGICLGGLFAMASPPEWLEPSTRGCVGALLFSFVTIAPPIGIGGIAHQALLWKLPHFQQPFATRIAVILSSLVVPLPLLLGPGGPASLLNWKVLVPMGIALTVYGLFARAPSTRNTEAP